MSSAVTVTVALSVQPGKVDDLLKLIPHLLQEMLSRPGALSSRTLQNSREPTQIVFVDEFDSAEASGAYFKWRHDRGDLDRLSVLLSQPPKVDVWSAKIAAPRI